MALVLWAGVAAAHRSPGVVSTVFWNAKARMTEIVHRLHVHDALTGIAPFTDRTVLDATSLADQARVALYVEERFALEHDGDPVRLYTLGAELVDDYLLVYQETARRLDDGAALRVRDDILRDAFPGSVNEVYLRGAPGERTRTLRFRGDDTWLTFPSTPAAPDGGGARTEGPPGTGADGAARAPRDATTGRVRRDGGVNGRRRGPSTRG